MKSLTKILLAAMFLAGTGYTIAKPHTTIKVNVAGPFDVDIVQGATESVKIEAPADVMEHILTDVNGGVLKIYNKHDMWNWGNWFGLHKKILVHVVIKDVNDINISGSGDVYFREGLTANSLKLSISGSGDMTGKVSVKTLESKITGSGDMKLAGNAESSTVSVVGSGDFTARNLVTASTAVRVSGSGDAAVNASDRLDAAVNGSGDINYSGGPKNINKRKSGSGDISGH